MLPDSVEGVAAEVRSGRLAAREAVGEQLARLHELDRSAHVIAWADDDLALAEAERRDEQFRADPGGIGPLHGVPVTVKDWIDVVGFPCAGDAGDVDRRPDADATAVRRLRAAGAIVIAKTVAWGPQPPDPAAVAHPVDPARSPGGSSTGEAVAVAAGASLVGLGSDSGGSARLPAAWCGAIGYKPTARLVPTTGHFPRVGERHDGRTQIGPIGRTIDDVAAVLGIIAGADDLDAGAPPVDWRESRTPGPLRFAVVVGDGSVVADTATERAVEAAADELRAAGMTPVGWDAPWLLDALDITERYWRRRQLSGAEVDRQLRDWDTFRFRYLRASQHVDLLLTPTTAGPAPLRRPIERIDFAYTLPASLTGSPAVAIPRGTDDAGLPLSVQLIGRPWHDATLLEAASILS